MWLPENPPSGEFLRMTVTAELGQAMANDPDIQKFSQFVQLPITTRTNGGRQPNNRTIDRQDKPR